MPAYRGGPVGAVKPPPAPRPRPVTVGPPILPVASHQQLASSQGYAQKSAAFAYRPPAHATYSPAGLPPPPAAPHSNMSALVQAIAKGTRQGTSRSVRQTLKQIDPHMWDVNPLSVGGWNIGRTDMGVDAHAAPGSPILAPNDSVVKGYQANWFQGQPYELLQLTKGPHKGAYYYVAEQIDPSSLPAVGSKVPRGEPVARFAASGTGIEMGLASSTPGTTLAAPVYHEGDVTSAGLQFRSAFIDKGVKPGSMPKGSPPSASGGGNMNNVSVVVGAPLSGSQKVFAAELSKRTGLDPGVVAAWVHSEQPPTGLAPNGPHNWLNIGATDSGFMGAQNPAWQNPKTAADFTARWLHGANAPGYGPASAGVRSILNAAHTAPANQVAAIQQSGWASSGYPQLAQAYNSIAGTARIATGSVTLPATAGYTGMSGGGGAALNPLASRGAPPSGGQTTVDPGSPAAQILQNATSPQQALAGLMTLNAAGLGIPGVNGMTPAQKRQAILNKFLTQQRGSSNPFNMKAGSSKNAFDIPASQLHAAALTSLQRLAGGTQLKAPSLKQLGL